MTFIKKWLKYQHQFDASSSNGRTRHSGCWYLGSNPGEAAIKNTLTGCFFIFKFLRKYAAADFFVNAVFIFAAAYYIIPVFPSEKSEKERLYNFSCED